MQPGQSQQVVTTHVPRRRPVPLHESTLRHVIACLNVLSCGVQQAGRLAERAHASLGPHVPRDYHDAAARGSEPLTAIPQQSLVPGVTSLRRENGWAAGVAEGWGSLPRS